jgi:hypothetical protein
LDPNCHSGWDATPWQDPVSERKDYKIQTPWAWMKDSWGFCQPVKDVMNQLLALLFGRLSNGFYPKL